MNLSELFRAPSESGPYVDEMVVVSTGPLRLRYPADMSGRTYPASTVGTAPGVGARVLVIHAGAAANYCLGPIA